MLTTTIRDNAIIIITTLLRLHNVRITHTIYCSIYSCFFYCVLCIILQCSNILQLQYVSVGYTSPVFLLLLLVGFLIIGNYTAASVEKCGLNSNTCVVVVAVLTSPSIDLECYQLFAILCLCVCGWGCARVTIVWARGFGY